MDHRRAFSVLAAGACSLALVVIPGPAHAAERPDGAAIVKVSADVAKATRITKGRYRVVLPADATVSWFGEAGSKDPRWGSFTSRSLVKGWQRLGHQRMIGVASTIIWGAGSDRAWAAALVSEPSVDEQGRLRLLVKSQRSLPSTLPDLGITVTRSGPEARGFPVSGSVGISDDVSLTVTATAFDATTTAFLPTGSTKNCFSFTMKGNDSHLIAGACKSVVINQGSIALLTPANGQSTSKPVTTCTSLAPGNELVSLYLNGASDSVEFIPLQWTYCGSVF